MKTHSLHCSILAVAAIAALGFSLENAVAQDSSTTNTASSANAAPVAAAPKLSYGVPQILQLAQAKVSDNIIVQYIQNSGTIYAPSASEIIYLHEQGVSDTVLNAMLDQRLRLTGSTEPAAPTPDESNAAQTAAPVAAPPPVAYVAPASAYTPPSTVYVIPDTQTCDYYSWFYSRPYIYSPYVTPYYGWGYPGLTFSFGFGGGGRGIYARPGFRGGFHRR